MTNNISGFLSSLPIDKIANQLGESPDDVRSAAEAIVPTLLMGMGANAQDPNGKESLEKALDGHDPALVEGEVDVEAIDTEDGAKIAHHIFGSQEEQVVSQLGGLGSGGSSLVNKLIPILAPLAMSWLAGQLTKNSQGGGAQGGLLEQILGQVLGSGNTQATTGGGGGFGEILGGLLGGGRR